MPSSSLLMTRLGSSLMSFLALVMSLFLSSSRIPPQSAQLFHVSEEGNEAGNAQTTPAVKDNIHLSAPRDCWYNRGWSEEYSRLMVPACRLAHTASPRRSRHRLS